MSPNEKGKTSFIGPRKQLSKFKEFHLTNDKRFVSLTQIFPKTISWRADDENLINISNIYITITMTNPTKQDIINIIKRTAKENAGKPLGIGRFEKEANIKVHEWKKYCAAHRVL